MHVLDLVHRGYQNPDGKNKPKPMKWILLDSVVIGLIAFCAVMPSTVPTAVEVWVMFKAFLGSFVFQLAVERGIKPTLSKEKER